MKSGPVVVVLAAGRGSRYGGARHKLAEPWGDRTVLSTTLHHAVSSNLPVVVVTTPAFADEAARQIARRDVVVMGGANGPALGGMGDSIAAGVAARPSAAGWLMLPADMPLLLPRTIRQVAEALKRHAVAFAQVQGRRGHPVGFSGELYADLVALSGDEGARRILARYPAHAVDVDDVGSLQDIDTQDDHARLHQQWRVQVGLSAA
ncbi:MAG: molybdopterin-guanine dinucleotide biosynthesis protein MobA [Ideonella sp. MAG2]|nr:MAG: molybdopterin-guanine dinucleotide biosynthesis protein MobA [Ideonella sp. MAG2]